MHFSTHTTEVYLFCFQRLLMQGHDDIGQDHQAALLTAALTRQAAAAVSVGTYWAWETIATLPSARRRKALRRPRGEERGGHIVAAARLQLVHTSCVR